MYKSNQDGRPTHVRRFLKSTICIRKIIRSKEARRKLLYLLDKEIKS